MAAILGIRSRSLGGLLSDKVSFTDRSGIDGPNPFRIAMSATPYGRNGRPEFQRGIKDSDRNMVYSLGQVQRLVYNFKCVSCDVTASIIIRCFLMAIC